MGWKTSALALEPQEDLTTHWPQLASPVNQDFSQRVPCPAEVLADDPNSKLPLTPQEAVCDHWNVQSPGALWATLSLWLGEPWLFLATGNIGSEVTLCGRLTDAWPHWTLVTSLSLKTHTTVTDLLPNEGTTGQVDANS